MRLCPKGKFIDDRHDKRCEESLSSLRLIAFLPTNFTFGSFFSSSEFSANSLVTYSDSAAQQCSLLSVLFVPIEFEIMCFRTYLLGDVPNVMTIIISAISSLFRLVN